MTKLKDSEAINKIIIELAKENNWLSKENLREKTKKGIQTIKNYLKNDINNLIETKTFIEKVARNTGKGDTAIEKYKLKLGLDNLLTIFNYLNDKNYQKQLMQTDYFKSLISDIKHKTKSIFQIDWNIKAFRVFGNMALTSPTFIYFLLIVTEDNLKSLIDGINMPKNILKRGFNNKLGAFFMIVYGLTFIDVLDGTIEQSNKEP